MMKKFRAILCHRCSAIGRRTVIKPGWLSPVLGMSLAILPRFPRIKKLIGTVGLGIGLVTLMITIARSSMPNYASTITFWNLELAFGMVVLIAGISSYFGVRKVLKIEPFDIFRG